MTQQKSSPPIMVSGSRGFELLRRDLLTYESILCDDLGRVLPFEAHALYFPTQDEVPAPVWVAEEDKLLLPLRRENRLLGVLLARGLANDMVEPLLPFLPGVAALCLDKLALYKRSRTDALSGLATREVLLEQLCREVSAMRQAFAVEPDWDGGSKVKNVGAANASLGLLVIRLRGMHDMARSHGHSFSENFMGALGDALRAHTPEEAIVARTGDAEFAVSLPGGTVPLLEDLALKMVQALESVRLSHPLVSTAARVMARAGYALFPQDWTGGTVHLGGERDAEDAATLFGKARLAAMRAGDIGDGETVLGYGSIVRKGGLIDQILPMQRVRTTLGRDVGAREGQRFSVWSLDYPVQERAGAAGIPPESLEPLYKGEIVLADVRGDTSQADILLQGDSAWPLAPGDRLALLPEDYSVSNHTPVTPDSPENSEGGKADPLTGLCRHGDFLARLAVAQEKYPAFGLALFRLELPSLDTEGRPLRVEHSMAEAAACLRRHMAGLVKQDSEQEWFAGRYSLNSILLFHAGLAAAAATELYPAMCKELTKELEVGVSVGIVCLPWLTFRSADALECCRKALEYGLLLPAPHVGVFNSLAITISADKRYSQGDFFGAIEEYRTALLADENNTLAWNSLGVSLAGVGRHAEARRAFEEAVSRAVLPASAELTAELAEASAEIASVYYNLGTACVTLGDLAAAATHFAACLALHPSHLFAHIRLGELAERQNPDEARSHYENALQADPASPQPHRCLARLELQSGHVGKARERLHQALLRHPQDPFSLHLLARLYLDGGEDAELAEALARQSVALRPDRKAAWLELARALEAQGRHKDAREARVKAAEL